MLEKELEGSGDVSPVIKVTDDRLTVIRQIRAVIDQLKTRDDIAPTPAHLAILKRLTEIDAEIAKLSAGQLSPEVVSHLRSLIAELAQMTVPESAPNDAKS